MKTTADVAIIGGGIIGAACAYFLSQAGLRTALVERDSLAAGTSGACDGLILLWDKLTDAELALGIESAALWNELAGRLPDAFEYSREGTVMLADSEDQLSAARAKASHLRSAGVAAEDLDSDGLRRIEPNLAPDLPGGVFFPTEAQLDSRRATISLVEAAKTQGLRVFAGVAVTGIRTTPDGRVTGVVCDDLEIDTPAVVCAAGVWSAEIAAWVGLDLPIKPRKGQIIVTSSQPRIIHHPLLEGGYAAAVGSTNASTQVAFVAERTSAGTMLLGSSREFSGYDRTVSIPVLQAIATKARRFLPKLENATVIRSYAGLRPWSPDHLPLIGPIASVPGFYLATGHEGAGIGLAPITGQIVALAVAGQALPTMAEAARPDRFFDPQRGGAVRC